MRKGILLTIAVIAGSLAVDAKTDEWYQECQGDECGYSGGRGMDSNCQDKHKDCRQFALQGECKINPNWMHPNCPKSCGLCLAAEDDDEACSDMHTDCPEWAKQLECFVNPAYMSRACPKSCWLCVNATDLRLEGVSEESIQRRRSFSQTDFGLWQALPEVNPEKAKAELQKMARYTMSLNNTG